MKPETQMKPRQYTLSTGKTRISLQAGQTNIHKAAPGESYRVLKRQGENDQEKLADDVVASRHGQDLQLVYRKRYQCNPACRWHLYPGDYAGEHRRGSPV